MTRYRKGARWLACVGAVLASTAALAGFQGDQWVSIDAANHAAAGDFGPTYNSPDRVQYISCRTGLNSASCEARTVNGNFAECFTTDPNFVATIRALHSGSYLYFRWEPQTRVCTHVHVNNFSVSSPKR